jgi:hypothetical protein
VGDDQTAAELLAWLEQQGYAQASTVVDEGHPGNRLTRMERGGCRVTVARDRGQWYVDAGPDDRDGFDMNLWEAYLRSQDPPVEPATFEDDARQLRNLLHEIERTLVLDEGAVGHLEGLDAWRQDRRWSAQAY